MPDGGELVTLRDAGDFIAVRRKTPRLGGPSCLIARVFKEDSPLIDVTLRRESDQQSPSDQTEPAGRACNCTKGKVTNFRRVALMMTLSLPLVKAPFWMNFFPRCFLPSAGEFLRPIFASSQLAPSAVAEPGVSCFVDDEFLAKVDAWANEQDNQPGRSETIRRLVEVGLKTQKSKRWPRRGPLKKMRS
jgi:hypothetical protein